MSLVDEFKKSPPERAGELPDYLGYAYGLLFLLLACEL